jgi:RNA polymerase sigma-70 factor (ECF subfamily)
MNDRDPAIDELVQRLTSCQPRLYAYIMTLLLDSNRTEDVLQQTNLVIWQKADEFKSCDNFEARACKVAYFQVLASRRDTVRDHHRILFDDRILDNIARVVSDRVAGMSNSYLAALRSCMKKLTDLQREVIRRRYLSGNSVTAIASDSGESADATSALLYRARKKLLACIQQETRQERDT